MSTSELMSKVRELKELKIMAEELAAEITTIEDDIKAEIQYHHQAHRRIHPHPALEYV